MTYRRHDTGVNARAAWNRAGTSLTITRDSRPGHVNRVDSGATYTVGVRARNAAGTSAWTNSAAVPSGQSVGANLNRMTVSAGAGMAASEIAFSPRPFPSGGGLRGRIAAASALRRPHRADARMAQRAALGNADTLHGLGGDDALRGDDGDDIYTGGPGDDRLVLFIGETGAEILTDFASGDRIVLKGRSWPSVADILAEVQAVGASGYVYPLAPGLSVQTTHRPLRVGDFLLEADGSP